MPSNALIVEVIGDTSKLTSSLKDAGRQMNKFAGRSTINASGKAQPFIDDLHRIGEESKETARREGELLDQQDAMASNFKRNALKIGAGGVALHVAATNLAELGGNAGKFGGAISDLTSLNFVGFVKGMQSINHTDPAKIGEDLLKFSTGAEAAQAADDFADAGMKDWAAAAKEAAKQIRAVESALHAANAEAEIAASLLFAGGKEGAAFGEGATNRFGRGPGAIDALNAWNAAAAGDASNAPWTKTGGITIPVVVDGKVVAKASAKYNRRTQRVNTAPRNGPGAGGYQGRN